MHFLNTDQLLIFSVKTVQENNYTARYISKFFMFAML